MKKLSVLAVLPLAIVAACATKPDKVKGSYVSPVLYERLNCNELRAEAERVSSRAVDITGVQDSKATKDAVVTGVALVVFWPAAFFVGGNDETAAELSRLKGEMEAIESVSNTKKCGIKFDTGEISAKAKANAKAKAKTRGGD